MGYGNGFKTIKVVFVLLLCFMISAQGSHSRKKGDALHTPVDPEKISIHVRVSGGIAETWMEMEIHNPRNRQMTGEMELIIPEGAVVTGFALDIDGVMSDGVSVPRSYGRQVFEELSHRRIDPGIVEWISADRIAMDVFPMPSDGVRKVCIGFISELTQIDGITQLYRLPLPGENAYDSFSIVFSGLDASVVPEGKNLPGESRFVFQNGEWKSDTAGLKGGEELEIELVPKPPETVRVETDGDGDTYFLIQDRIPWPADFTPPLKSAPGNVALLWDASGSCEDGDHEREFRFLEKYFSTFSGSDIHVEVSVFALEQEAPVSFEVKQGNCDALIAFLRGVSYDGGTRLERVKLREPEPGNGEWDSVFLFSDGRCTIGDPLLPKMDAPLFLFSAGDRVDRSVLRYLARTAKGSWFDLGHEEDEDICNEINRERPQFLSLRLDGQENTELFAHMKGNSSGFVLNGRLKNDASVLTMEYGIPGVGTEKWEYRIQKKATKKGEVIRNFWARAALEGISALPGMNKERIAELGLKFGLVTPYSSLIVLDSLDQYLRYRIPPPPSLPELRKKYEEQIKDKSPGLRQSRMQEDAIHWSWEGIFDWWRDRSLCTYGLFLNGRGEIFGTVYFWDNTGKHEPLPGSTVTLMNSDNKYIQVYTDDQGRYRFNLVPSGVYSLKAELEGLDFQEISGIYIAGDMHFRQNLGISFLGFDEKVTIGREIPTESNSKERPLQKINAESLKDAWNKKGNVVSLESVRPASATFSDVMKPGSERSYLEEIARASEERKYEAYLVQRRIYGNSPRFFLDCFRFFYSLNRKDIGLRILSNLAETEFRDSHLSRILGIRFEQAGAKGLAEMEYKRLVDMNILSPVAWRDWALALAGNGKFVEVVDCLNRMIVSNWPGQNTWAVKKIAMMELNGINARAKRAGVLCRNSIIPTEKDLDVDLRVVLSSYSDLQSMELIVDGPGVEPLRDSDLSANDRFNRNVLSEYMIHKVKRGKYRVKLSFSQRFYLSLKRDPLLIRIDIYCSFGTPYEQRKTVMLWLQDKPLEDGIIAEIDFSRGKRSARILFKNNLSEDSY